LGVLERLEPVSERYATAPVAEAFTWSEAAPDFGDGEWYMVAFRSVRRPGADEARLSLHDELAHQEAAGAPGFVDYFKGPCAMDRTCLSFCLWKSRAEARSAAGKPAHLRAIGLLDEMYESYTLEFHRLTRTAGGPLLFEPYDRPGGAAHVHVSGPGLHPVADAPTGPLLPAPSPATG
jgi:hypothetical protein